MKKPMPPSVTLPLFWMEAPPLPGKAPTRTWLLRITETPITLFCTIALSPTTPVERAKVMPTSGAPWTVML